MKEVGINLSEFQSTISGLRSSASSIESSIKTNRTFNKTNIKPFIQDLEHVIKAAELLTKYQALLSSDIDVLEQTGEQIREKDEELATMSNMDITGPQRLHS